jgi:aminopeptidase N
MSALNDSSTPTEEDGFILSNWNQPVPVAAYLIALAAGELSSKDISERVVSIELKLKRKKKNYNIQQFNLHKLL